MNRQMNHDGGTVAAPILVTGGTGRLGRLVVPRLLDAGRDVRVLSRQRQDAADDVEYVIGDLLTCEGVERAVDGVGTILHLAGAANAKGDDEATRNLVRAAARAGVQHVVHISVIGADRVPLGYFKSKLEAEQAVVDSGLPFTILRAAQVHDLVLTMVQAMAKLPVIPVPGGVRFEPVDADEVAARLAALTLGEPSGMVSDLTGPEVHGMDDLIRDYLRQHGKRRLLVPFRMPGKAGRAYRAGGNLSIDGAATGKRTWEDFLAEQVNFPSDTEPALETPGHTDDGYEVNKRINRLFD
ncbi:SDR family oxidoreductase [Arthrobacter sp. H14]|uniref:SDR family oxidoreductase n=1 Tax=Arthrobacter sp. H14 TaxID=1312959 RepID=UPI0004BC12E5|nr:NAD(P)H-binding protein [Arthrobacter sp. H14]